MVMFLRLSPTRTPSRFESAERVPARWEPDSSARVIAGKVAGKHPLGRFDGIIELTHQVLEFAAETWQVATNDGLRHN
jgi:hypothetical protein